MNIYIKKIIFVFLILSVVVSVVACSVYDAKFRCGKEGAVADFSWAEYDDLINLIKNTSSSKERDKYLHLAEELLMEETCVIPVNSVCNKFLCRKGLKNIYIDKTRAVHIENMYSEKTDRDINMQLYEEPETLDPGHCLYARDHNYLSIIYSSIVKYDENGKLVNVFLDHYVVSDDELTWKLVLKNGLKWSDGKPLTAYDLEYTLKRNANTKTGCPLSFVFNSIEGYPNNLNVKAMDDVTLEVKLSHKCPYFLSFWIAAAYTPLREDIVEKSKDWYLTLPNVSCGPYILKEWKHNESIVLEKNPYYFDAENIRFDHVNLMLNTNVSSVLNAYAAGDLDFAFSIPENFENEDVSKFKTAGNNFLKVNVKSKMFAGLSHDEAKKLRKAIACCIDRKFIEDMSYDLLEKAYTFVNDLFLDSEGKQFLRNSENYIYPYKYGYFEETPNFNKARELLREIGYHIGNDGKVMEDITFEMMGKTSQYNTLSIIQADLEKVGINMKIRKEDYAFANAGKFDMMYVGWTPDYDDPLAMLELFASDNVNNTCFLGRSFPIKNIEKNS